MFNHMLLTPCLPSPQEDVKGKQSKISDQNAKNRGGANMQAYKE